MAGAKAQQLGLFASELSGEQQAEARLEARFDALRAVADGLPDLLRFGTSSWSFPGWRDIVYPKALSESFLAREGLRLYVRHPLLRTVGIDRGYYASLTNSQWRSYAEQLPEGFVACAKAPALFTSPIVQTHGARQTITESPCYLDASKFTDMVLKPYLENMGTRAGPMIFEFPALPKAHRVAPMQFAENLYRFFERLPSTLPYAVELRDPALITPAYVDALIAHGVSHTYNYWTAMPGLEAQSRMVPISSGESVIVRLLLRPGTGYEERKRQFLPFDKIVDPNEQMRREVIEIALSAIALGKAVFVLVNNKAEGSSPLTIERLGEMAAEKLGLRGRDGR